MRVGFDSHRSPGKPSIVTGVPGIEHCHDHVLIGRTPARVGKGKEERRVAPPLHVSIQVKLPQTYIIGPMSPASTGVPGRGSKPVMALSPSLSRVMTTASYGLKL